MLQEQIKEQYKKEGDGKTYLLLKKTRESFEERMIREARPEGILPMVKSEECNRYKYEITGRKHLAMTFERVSMNVEQVQKVLQSMFEVLERGKEYLLSEDSFILLPEYIFLKIPEYEVQLCYYPEYKTPFSEQMGKLFEMLLNRVDYREKEAISLVYALYMQIQEPDMTLERLRKLLLAQGEKAEIPETLTGEQKPRGIVQTAEEKKMELTGGEKGEAPKKRSGFWERLRKEGGKAISLFCPPVAEPSQVMEAPQEWGVQCTRVLSVKNTKGCPVLVAEKEGERVLLEKFPFYIGSLSTYMDYVIERDTVSRFHAKLIKQGDCFFLTDLNSTNGTKVNGHTLEIQEQRQLTDGDRIAFADVEYLFFTEKPS